MKKTIQVNLAGQVFTLDEDAYELLTDYLANIARLYEHSAGRDEIIQDIEARIAELFIEKLIDLKVVIDTGDVQHIITVLGKPEEFEGAEEATQGQRQAREQRVRALFRDPEDRLLGGVCAGLAHYFGINPLWLRLAFVAAVVFFGTGVLLYIILWILIPAASSTADRLKMKGEPINIGSIGKIIEDEINALGNAMKPGSKGDKYARKTTNAIERFFALVIKLVVLLLRFAGKVIGVFLSFFGVVFIIALIAVLIGVADAFHFSHDVWNASYNVYEMGHLLFDSSLWFGLALAAATLIVLCPLLLLLYAGIALLIPDFRIPYLSGSVFGLWLVAIGLGVFVGISTAQQLSKDETLSDSIPLESLGVTADTINIELADDPFNVVSHRAYGANRNFMMKKEGKRVILSYVTVTILPSRDDKARVNILRSANGEYYNEAAQRADSIRYLFQHSKDALKFNAYFSFPESDCLRDQEVKAQVELPIGKAVYLSSASKRVVYDVKNIYDMHDSDMYDHYWIMTKKGLECMDCEGITPPDILAPDATSDSTLTTEVVI